MILEFLIIVITGSFFYITYFVRKLFKDNSNEKKSYKYEKPLFIKCKNPIFPTNSCKGCLAGEMDGVGCIYDKSRGCWLIERKNIS